jgi:hypothetical protein
MAESGKTSDKAADKRNFFATMSSGVIASIKKAAIDDDRTASDILEEAATEWLARRQNKAGA